MKNVPLAVVHLNSAGAGRTADTGRRGTGTGSRVVSAVLVPAVVGQFLQAEAVENVGDPFAETRV